MVIYALEQCIRHTLIDLIVAFAPELSLARIVKPTEPLRQKIGIVIIPHFNVTTAYGSS